MKKRLKNLNVNKRSIQCIAVILGVIILPLLYSYFYLGAFWDPYSKLESFPVAVVNEDAGATINGEERNLGKEVCDKLIEDGSLKFIMTTREKAEEGTKGDDYYAMIVIPAEFSSNISSVSSTEKQSAVITYSPNEKRNYLASQILSRAVLEIEESTRASVDGEITNQLADKLKEVPTQMVELQDGANQLNDGAVELNDGATKLADGTTTLSEGAVTLAQGTSTFYSKFADFKTGMANANTGAGQLNAGLTELNTGMTKLVDGSNQLVAATTKLKDLSGGALSLNSGADAMTSGVNDYVNGVNKLIASTRAASDLIGKMVSAAPALMMNPQINAAVTAMSDPANAQALATLEASGPKLLAAANELEAGSKALSDGATNLVALNQGMIDLQLGLQSASAGTAQLASGSAALTSGMATLNDATGQLYTAAGDIADGSSKLSDGATQLQDGATQLADGTGKLQDGTTELKDGIDTSLTDINSELVKLDGIGDYAKEPVNVVQENITSVPNYGTAFAPYFLSLSLWVGGLIIFVAIYYDGDGKFKLLSARAENKLLRSSLYIVIGLIQALVLGIVIVAALGLKVDNLLLYFASCCLVSITFIAIIQFLMVFLKDIGKFLSMVLLILQLTSCGGTFPMETVPKFFQVLYPFMPMTYSVKLFKEGISGVESANVIKNGGILLGIFAVFFAMTAVCSLVRLKKRTMEENLVFDECCAE